MAVAVRRDTSRTETGIVTLMFTDLVRSSELIEALGDDASNRATRAHFRLLREIVATHGGQEVKSLGDGLMIVFPSAVKALSCAIAMQRAVHERNDALGADLEIRIGLHAGEPVRNKDDYFGQPVVIAKRLCDRAEAGQIIVSGLVESIVGGRREFKFEGLGLLALKGISTPVEAREVVWTDNDGSSGPEPLDEPAVGHRSRRLSLVVLAATVGAVGALAALLLTDEQASDAGSRLSGGDFGRNPRPPRATAGTDWDHIEFPSRAGLGGPGRQAINRMATDGTRLVAVGTERFESGEVDGAAWVSEDLKTWQRVGRRVFGDDGTQEIWGVAIQRGITVAVGFEDTGLGWDPAVWTSKSGPWRKVEDQPDLRGPGNQGMSRVVGYRGGFIAVGFDDSGGDEDAAVWRSRNGSRWVRVHVPDAALGGEGDQRMFGVTVGPKLIVAVGEDGSRAGLPGGVDGAVWTSTNGTRWRRISSGAFRVESDQTIRAVEAVKRGFVAVGSTGLGIKTDAASWRSDNGLLWERSPGDEAQLGGDRSQVMWSVAVAGDVVYAAGYDKHGGGLDAAIWTSKDLGRTWTREARNEEVFGGDREQAIKSLALFDARIVAGGWDRSVSGSEAQIWYRPIEKENLP